MYPDRYEAYSAGVMATSVDPRAARAMAEIGIDISAFCRYNYVPSESLINNSRDLSPAKELAEIHKSEISSAT
jgi:protein-tyrosine-phosphatase